MSSTPADALPVIAVACGVLQRADGTVLLAQRPAGKIAAGYWEFPGGKIEAGESTRQALDRELGEELGIAVREARPLIRLRHAYTNRIVVLDTWLVTGFDSEPRSCEGQALAWVDPQRIVEYNTLPTVSPILKPLRLPSDYVFTAPNATPDSIRRGLSGLPRGALLRLRLPFLESSDYTDLARSLTREVAACGLRLVLDRDPELSQELGVAWHAPVAAWRDRVEPPRVPLFIGSAHSRAELLVLRERGADAAVLGHVLATASHVDQPGLGWSGFARAAGEVGLPVYAIGGVGPKDRHRAWQAGGQGCAGIQAYW